MKIICTEEEKENLIRVISTGPVCLFRKHPEIICEGSCPECLRENVIWETDNDHNNLH